MDTYVYASIGVVTGLVGVAYGAWRLFLRVLTNVVEEDRDCGGTV